MGGERERKRGRLSENKWVLREKGERVRLVGRVNRKCGGRIVMLTMSNT